MENASFLNGLPDPVCFITDLNFFKESSFYVFNHPLLFAYQSLFQTELIHDTLANFCSLSPSQSPIRQLEQESLGLGNVWILV